MKLNLNIHTLIFTALSVKALVLGIGLPEALAMIALVGLEGYVKYLNSKKVQEITDADKARLTAIEGKIALWTTTRRMS